MDKRFIALLLALVILIPVSTQAQANDATHGRLVIVIVLDAYNPYYNGNMTALNDLASQYGYTVPLEVQYPSVTIVSHMTFVTGLLPNVTNILNTYVYDPEKLRSNRAEPDNAKLYRDDLVNTTTLYGIAGDAGYLTALITAKSKLVALLGPEGSATVFKQYPYSYDLSSLSDMLEVNEWLMNETKITVENRIDAIASGQRGYLLVNLPGTDYIGHNYGPYSDEYKTILEQEQELVVDFINRLKNTEIRSRTLVIVLGDHSMEPVDYNDAAEDTTTHALMIPELASNGIVNIAVPTSGASALVYLQNNDTQTIEQAVQVLRASGKIDGVRTSVPVAGANGTLYDIGLNSPYAGDLFVSFKPPYYFSGGSLRGAHGGYATKYTQARVLTGRPEVLKQVNELTSIDVATMSFGFLGLEPIGLGKLDKVLDPIVLSDVSAKLPAFVAVGESFNIAIEYKLPSGTEGQISVELYDSNGNLVTERNVTVSSSGTIAVTLGPLNAGAYKIVIKLYSGNQELAGKVYNIAVQEKIETEVSQPVGKMLVSVVLLVLIIVGAIYLAKRMS